MAASIMPQLLEDQSEDFPMPRVDDAYKKRDPHKDDFSGEYRRSLPSHDAKLSRVRPRVSESCPSHCSRQSGFASFLQNR
jgi:hypothetical protein